MIEITKTLVVTALVTLAVINDLKTRKIPNRLTVPFVLFGLGFNAITLFPQGILIGLGGLIAGFLIFLIPYMMKGMGAGDIKLMAAIGAISNWRFVLYVALFTALAGGVIALFSRAKAGGIILTLKRTLQLIQYMWFSLMHRVINLPTLELKKEKYRLDMTDQKSDYIPYALAIFTGCIITLFITWMGFIPGLSI